MHNKRNFFPINNGFCGDESQNNMAATVLLDEARSAIHFENTRFGIDLKL